MKELDFNELEKVTGGKLTPEATAWISRNEETIRARANEKNLGALADFALLKVTINKNTFDVADIKAFLAGYIDVSDLN